MVCYVDSNGKGKYVGAIQKADKEAWFKATCEPGEYYCIVYTPWKSFTNEITWSSYGPQEIELRKITERELKPDIFTGVIQDKATRDQTGFNNYAQHGEPDIRYKYENGNDGIGYFYIENNSKGSTANITIDFVSLNN